MRYIALLWEIPKAILAVLRALFTGDWNEDGERDDWTR